LDAAALYPEYWTDPAIARCPSDASADSATAPYMLEPDWVAQITRISKATGGTDAQRKACLYKVFAQSLCPEDLCMCEGLSAEGQERVRPPTLPSTQAAKWDG